MKIYVAHGKDFDFVGKLYTPLQESSLSKEHEFFFPHQEGNSFNTKDLIPQCNAVLAEVSVPSTGEGIELGRAEAAKVPIICIYEKGAKVSGSLGYLTRNILEYETSHDMLEKVEIALKTLQ